MTRLSYRLSPLEPRQDHADQAEADEDEDGRQGPGGIDHSKTIAAPPNRLAAMIQRTRVFISSGPETRPRHRDVGVVHQGQGLPFGLREKR
jgi:hypothetical protein